MDDRYFQIVDRCLLDWDVMQLFPGAPQDEYEAEAYAIAARLPMRIRRAAMPVRSVCYCIWRTCAGAGCVQENGGADLGRNQGMREKQPGEAKSACSGVS